MSKQITVSKERQHKKSAAAANPQGKPLKPQKCTEEFIELTDVKHFQGSKVTQGRTMITVVTQGCL